MSSTESGPAAERRQYPRTNQMLAARVCVEIDETIAHADSIQVFADGDHVTLRGTARPDELVDALSAASSVPGVGAVITQLETTEA